MPVDVVAIVTPDPSKVSRVEELLNQLTKSVHENEPDVLRYKPYRTTDPETGVVEFVFVERYKDEKTLEEHSKTEVFRSLGPVFEEEKLLAKPFRIMMLEPLKEGFDGR